MFKLKRTLDGKELTIYGTWINGGSWRTQFLIYEDNKWEWQNAEWFEPI